MQGYIGEIKMFASGNVPQSWMSCEGQLLNPSSYPHLFAQIGTTYGGNGTTTFALPDLRGASPIGFGQGNDLANYSLGSMGGAEIVSLLATQMPAHTHTATATVTGTVSPKCLDDTGLGDTPGGQYPAVCSESSTKLYTNATQTPDAEMGSSPIDATASVSIGSAGSSQPVNIRNPYTAINFIICVEPYIPS